MDFEKNLLSRLKSLTFKDNVSLLLHLSYLKENRTKGFKNNHDLSKLITTLVFFIIKSVTPIFVQS